VAWVIGASSIGAEWQARSITTLLTWEPRRARVLAAKVVERHRHQRRVRGASIGRNTAAALGVGFAYFLVVENVVGNFLAGFRRWLILGNSVV